MTFPRLHSKGRWQSTNLCSVGSTSLQLTPGTYDVTISDTTNYDVMPYGIDLKSRPLEFPLHMDVQPWNMREMMGRVSLEGEEEAKEVSLRVAEFLPSGKRNDNFDGTDISMPHVNALDPSKPVWVVVHGMNSSERGEVETIAHELSLQRQLSGQVVTINWEEAADTITTRDAPWTKNIGQWVASRLINMGFSPENINFAAHSHGTYVAYAAAREVMEQKQSEINAIVALDPAGNVPLISGFNDNEINFANVSRNSIAMEGSWMAGQDSLAATADTTFKIESGNTLDVQILTEHSLPMSTFVNLLRTNRLSSEMLPANLRLGNIMNAFDLQPISIEENVETGGYEGTIQVTTRERTDAYGRAYTEAVPTTILETLSGYTSPKRWDILNLDSTIQASIDL